MIFPAGSETPSLCIQKKSNYISVIALSLKTAAIGFYPDLSGLPRCLAVLLRRRTSVDVIGLFLIYRNRKSSSDFSCRFWNLVLVYTKKEQLHFCNCSFIKNGGYRILSRFIGTPTLSCSTPPKADKRWRDWAFSDLSESEELEWFFLPVLKPRPCVYKKKSNYISVIALWLKTAAIGFYPDLSGLLRCWIVLLYAETASFTRYLIIHIQKKSNYISVIALSLKTAAIGFYPDLSGLPRCWIVLLYAETASFTR